MTRALGQEICSGRCPRVQNVAGVGHSEETAIAWEAVDQVELPWSAQGEVLELTRGQDSGGSAHTDDPLLEILKRCPGPPWS